MRKVVSIGLVVLVLAAGGFFFWRWRHSAGVAEAEDAVQQTAAVKRGSLRQTVPCTGRIVSNLDVEIKCKASGQVVNLPFDVSNEVKKDDLIVEIDPIDQERGVLQAQAALAGSQARLAQAVANLAVAEKTLEVDRVRAQAALAGADARVKDSGAKAKREGTLLEKKLSSIEETETAQTAAIQAEADLQTARAQTEALKVEEAQLEVRRQDIKLSQAEVDSDKIALEVANQRLSETKLKAPMGGVVSARPVNIGQIIASGVTNVGGGTTILTLSDLSRMFILGSVDEAYIGSVALGQRAEITADSYPRQPFAGKVDRIATKGVSVSNVVTFEVRIEVTSENKNLLKPEMTANIDIVVAEKDDALSVPINAISRSRDKSGEKTFVSLKNDDGTVEDKHPVETGITAMNDVEVVAGLQENDQVVLHRSEADSRWRAGQGIDPQRARMMMMRSMGGGGGGRR